MFRRGALALTFLLIGALTVAAFNDVVDLGDTLSAHWMAGSLDRLAVGVCVAGAILLLAGVALRAFGATLVSGLTALACLGLGARSWLNYPAAADDAAAPMVLMRSRAELAGVLAAVIVVAAVAAFVALRGRGRSR